MTKSTEVFEKIPNNFFYDNPIREKQNWRNALLIYFLFTSRKNMNNDIYMSYKEINDILQFNKNIYRSKPIIANSLNILKEYGLLGLPNDLVEANNNLIIKFKWVEQFPSYGGKGWTKFYADDFELHSKIGNIPYLVMWVLRMYTNHATTTSFISISDITSILECDRNKVQNAINLFKKYQLFEVITGDYYFHEELGKNIKQNNEYKYTKNIEGILSVSQGDINKMLFPVRNANKYINN
ncbi:hypothetical protein ACR77J_07715 [Tissierella praeacuta]|uniref:hypothetical protein n=1 Tax=Tissierella praeacuta TaxID=43131 RepID=UPI003DA434D7